jgi:hypothetical protein
MFDLRMYYDLLCGDGMGNTVWSDNLLQYLKDIKHILSKKYGEQNFRVKYLSLCIIKAETGEFEIEEREWVRYILHPEAEPQDSHNVLLEELEEQMKTITKI